MAQTVEDTFTRPDGSIAAAAMDSGHTWTLQTQGPYNGSVVLITPGTSDIDITSGEAHGGTAGGPGSESSGRYNRATVDHGTANVEITLDAILPFDQGTGISIIFRWATTDEHWDCLLYRSLVGGGPYDLHVRKFTGYGFPSSALTSFSVIGSGGTGTHQLKVRADGDEIKPFLNGGAALGTVTDAYNQTETLHGIGTYLGDSTNHLDNYLGVPILHSRFHTGMSKRTL